MNDRHPAKMYSKSFTRGVYDVCLLAAVGVHLRFSVTAGEWQGDLVAVEAGISPQFTGDGGKSGLVLCAVPSLGCFRPRACLRRIPPERMTS